MGPMTRIKVNSVTPLFEIFDMPTSVKFYRDVLGFELVATGGEDWAMLKLGGAFLMLNTRYEADQRPPAPDPSRVAGHQDTELYFDCANVDETYEYLLSRGLDVKEPRVMHYGMKQLTVADPDGFRLIFQCEAPEE
jgi:glyoxylase I family protein